MKFHFKSLLLLSLLSLVVEFKLIAGDSSKVQINLDLREVWNERVSSHSCQMDTFSFVYSDYEQDTGKWIEAAINSDQDSLILASSVIVCFDTVLGYFIHTEEYSRSGDWFKYVDEYYTKQEQIHLMVWNMNTFMADIPLRLERIWLFDDDGKIISKQYLEYDLSSDSLVTGVK